MKRAKNKVAGSSLTNAEDVCRRQQLDKDISSLESKKSKMTDMLIDGIINEEVYDDKMIEFNRKLHPLVGKKPLLNESINKQKDVEKRMAELRRTLKSKGFSMNSTGCFLKVPWIECWFVIITTTEPQILIS